MRIVHLMQSSARIYGAERCVLLELSALQRRGHAVTTVLLHETRLPDEEAWVLPRALWDLGIPVELVETPRQAAPGTLLGLFRALRRLRPDVVQSHGMKTDVLGFLVTRPLRIPFLVEVHGFLHPDHDRLVRAYEALDYAVLRRCEGALVLSTAYRDELRSLGVPPARTHLLPSGIDVEGIAAQAGRRDLRRELGIAPGTPVAGIVARLSPEKGHKDFLWALAETRRHGCAAVGVVFGDGPLRQELQAEAGRLGLAGAVRFPGYVPEVADAYRAMDVLVSCSLYEGLPLNLIEAMALSLPVLAMATGGCADIVADGETGVLVPRGDRQALARGLLRLLQDPALRERLGRAGLDRARARYSLSAWAEGAEAVYRQVRRSR